VPFFHTRVLPLLALAVCATAANRRVAITIDDLPRGGDGGPRTLAGVETMTKELLRPFREQRIPVIGFVNEGRKVDFGPEGLRQILDLWLDSGADLGNHSRSHLNINKVPLEQYTADILLGEPVLRAALEARGKKLEFYRHPFLFTGPTPEVKRQLQQFLDAHGYRVAPVTLDDSDWEFAALYTQPQYTQRVRRAYIPYMESIVAFFERRAMEVVGRDIPQILLIHASQLNADLMPDLLAMFRRRGYTFVSLREALTDDAYRLPEEYAGPGGFSWIHRWSITKGMAPKGEPEPPHWVEEAWAAQSPRSRVAPAVLRVPQRG
jgi:peptidoglycan/xylan/chitin deacetylase (PgdA/CDA1 family)